MCKAVKEVYPTLPQSASTNFSASVTTLELTWLCFGENIIHEFDRNQCFIRADQFNTFFQVCFAFRFFFLHEQLFYFNLFYLYNETKKLMILKAAVKTFRLYFNLIDRNESEIIINKMFK